MENLKAKVGEAFAAKQASIRRANEYLEETATYQDKYRAENVVVAQSLAVIVHS